jgi:signal transduction histidine kinase
LKAQTQTIIADIRRLVYDLRPPALDELGLVSALREQAAHYSEFNGLQVSTEAPEQLPPLPAAVEVVAYRIALEALTNVARHAHARTCCIRLSLAPTAPAHAGHKQANQQQDMLCLEILDDGVGLPMHYQSGVGVNSMRERAAELGGSCLVESVMVAGTRILVRLPLPKE